MYRVRNNLCPPYMKDSFELDNSSYNLRMKEFLLPRFNTTSYGKYSMKYLGPQLRSKLNSNIRNAPSIDAFIKAIRKQDLDVLVATNGKKLLIMLVLVSVTHFILAINCT